MLDVAEIRHRVARDFDVYYEHVCATRGLPPLPMVKSRQGSLEFNPDGIGQADWTPVLAALAVNKQLQHVSLRSSRLATGAQTAHKVLKKKTPAVFTKSLRLQLCKAVQKCLSESGVLRRLELHGLPLRERELAALTQGLAKTLSLQHLSLAHCPIADRGLEVICQSVKYSTVINSVDFTGCGITWRGAEHMANIIKHQAFRRHDAAWMETLRYRRAAFEAMAGLRRITLNDNILIGDRGAVVLADELTDDLWVKAVDLQGCGISNHGAKVLEQMIQSNSTLCVLDIRRNPLIDDDVVKAVLKKVLMNAKGSDAQYVWIKPPSLKDAPDQSRPSLRRNAGRRPSLGSVSHASWRSAGRARAQRAASQAHRRTVQTFQHRRDSDTETVSEGEEQAAARVCPSQKITSIQFRRLQMENKRLQVELQECRLRLAEERNARLESNSRLLELEREKEHMRSLNRSLSEAYLSSSVLDDERMLESIETSFKKFHGFLDLLKDAGLGQFASLAGIDQSHFGFIGGPQLSSTKRTRVDHKTPRAPVTEVTPRPASSNPATPVRTPRPQEVDMSQTSLPAPVTPDLSGDSSSRHVRSVASLRLRPLVDTC